jgi:hypothetical protein
MGKTGNGLESRRLRPSGAIVILCALAVIDIQSTLGSRKRLLPRECSSILRGGDEEAHLRACACRRRGGLPVPFADIDDFSWGADDEASAVNAPRCSRPGWLWIGYMAFGIAFWAGLGFAIRALLPVI